MPRLCTRLGLRRGEETRACFIFSGVLFLDIVVLTVEFRLDADLMNFFSGQG